MANLLENEKKPINFPPFHCPFRLSFTYHSSSLRSIKTTAVGINPVENKMELAAQEAHNKTVFWLLSGSNFAWLGNTEL